MGEVTDDTRALWDEMERAMRAMPGARGVGLAAPQIGHPVALAILDAGDTPARALRLADPRIVSASEEMSRHVEGSPNLPGAYAEIRRPASVRVAFLNEQGAPEERAFDGLWARSVQHQIDHLAGRMFFDRLSRTRREMLLRKARRAAG